MALHLLIYFLFTYCFSFHGFSSFYMKTCPFLMFYVRRSLYSTETFKEVSINIVGRTEGHESDRKMSSDPGSAARLL